ncbi:adenosylmethionine-8-amino-7-oxononanoate aminotransferase [Schizosaccharomyces japonicus yFS275]|uniref:Adenosylmethionine-8-amino-7-oxononanoate aminotransferase n=1 Tax=Schizosaccharomyces japonicus (strain yFS275 / FY16936) TaxID=402676 RepID=B6JWA0_SCHJY|nr:adenosylmethionine-8-amino-7-oxononanoate aminotransferase [Schizosaccharomyces japonicus yFS275]EEB05651.1 adenosylmethionine-8-amino-7-oxononanoate aminotransferase [Schizosaccharomyces japonicus yFS275]
MLAHILFGANTEVGKTIWSTALCYASHYLAHAPVEYIKPVGAGPVEEADYVHLAKFVPCKCTNIHQFEKAMSPHMSEGAMQTTDASIVSALRKHLQASSFKNTFVETAGGVSSPAPSGSLQCDLYRPLRLPVLLIGDSKLGGISTTIAAYEQLKVRGYDISAILMLRDPENAPQYENWKYFSEIWSKSYSCHDKENIKCFTIPSPPALSQDAEADFKAMQKYYSESASVGYDVLKHIEQVQKTRLARLDDMINQTEKHIWYPFTQHTLVNPKEIAVIDSAHGDMYTVFAPNAKRKSEEALADGSKKEGSVAVEENKYKELFDASASWWTQGLGHGDPYLAMSAAYAAGRYGHVLLPNCTNEPALGLAEDLLSTVGKGWANRVYYSDNGATGMEIALKMALKAARIQHQLSGKIEIIGLEGAYHGDTIGTMDACPPNVYNVEVDWYDGRGIWFDSPVVKVSNGEVSVQWEDKSFSFTALDDVYNVSSRVNSHLAKQYASFIGEKVRTAMQQGHQFGALVIEPLVVGAGGMLFVDPLFQRVLVDIAKGRLPESPWYTEAHENKKAGIPVVFDEVFIGLYRLGQLRSADILGVYPDVQVNAKLLTGGLVPLSVTLASEELFEYFLSDKKSDALLHGHSYTAHPVGCHVARQSLKRLDQLNRTAWTENKQRWLEFFGCQNVNGVLSSRNPNAWSVWDPEWVYEVSKLECVESIMALGSLASVVLKAGDHGYQSSAAGQYLSRLREFSTGAEEYGILARPLGNVVYFMTSQITPTHTVKEIQAKIIDVFSQPR